MALFSVTMPTSQPHPIQFLFVTLASGNSDKPSIASLTLFSFQSLLPLVWLLLSSFSLLSLHILFISPLTPFLLFSG